MIEGGWEFVWSAYGLVWLALSAYAFSLWNRHQKLNKREKGL